jgi:hypothetical protein
MTTEEASLIRAELDAMTVKVLTLQFTLGRLEARTKAQAGALRELIDRSNAGPRDALIEFAQTLID